jgi:hypothetical protein
MLGGQQIAKEAAKDIGNIVLTVMLARRQN